jgi:hypothetical protein
MFRRPLTLNTLFRHSVVYAYRVFVAHGGLMSYATDQGCAQHSAGKDT